MSEEKHYFFKALISFVLCLYASYSLNYFAIPVTNTRELELFGSIFFFLGLIVPVIYIALGVWQLVNSRSK